MNNVRPTFSPKPYLIRAFYEWIVDNQWTPYITVNATLPGTDVPKEHVQDGKIILNLSPTAVKDLHLNNDCIDFYARFSGVVKLIRVPIRSVLAIYARENGQGSVFNENEEEESEQTAFSPSSTIADTDSPTYSKGKPTLRIVKSEPD